MSVDGTFRTWRDVRVESAFGGKADIPPQGRDFRFGKPKADVSSGVSAIAAGAHAGNLDPSSDVCSRAIDFRKKLRVDPLIGGYGAPLIGI